MPTRCATRLLAALALPICWLCFGSLWWSPLVFATAMQSLGAALPIPTAWIIAAAAYGLPLALMLLYTLILAWLAFRPGPRTPTLVAALLGIALTYLAIALLALAIPLQKCGERPPLPWEQTVAQASTSFGPTCQSPAP